ncbi:MAG: hypothetical protein JO267_14330 [Alphaproteobacteria bacterium]|nr:hypothetical protein [Alphaproteobacteria bacterium]
MSGLMRSTAEIVGAVQECQPATDQELRYALMSLWYWAQMTASSLAEHSDLPSGDGKGYPAFAARRRYEEWFAGMKLPVDQRLGPRWTPGTRENREGRALSAKVMAAVEKRSAGR